MQPLSSMDASWFHGESPRMPFHVANLHLFDKPTGKVDLFARLREQVAARAAYLPLLHRKLDLKSLGLGNPVWLNEPELDLDYHVRRVRLAEPGGRQELAQTVVELHKPLLDRRHPLWQIVLIEGLEDGGYAIYMKLHHGGVDGGSASMVVDGIFADEAVVQGGAPGSEPLVRQAANLPTLLWNTAMDWHVRTPLRMMRAAREMMEVHVASMSDKDRFDARDMMELMQPAPRTPFNTGLTTARTWGWTSLPLADVKAFGKAHQATINDVVLAVITGALRRHLAACGRLPTRPLVAGVPVSVRVDDDTAHNNQVSLMLAKLPANEADPKRWMPVIRRSVQAAKKLQAAARPMARLQVEVPSLRMPVFNNLASLQEAFKAAEDLRMHNHLPPFVNLWVSNVPGPRKPLMFAGQAARTFIPVALVMHGAALNVTCISYMDRIDFGVLACTTALADAQLFADGLAEEYEALKQNFGEPAALAG